MNSEKLKALQKAHNFQLRDVAREIASLKLKLQLAQRVSNVEMKHDPEKRTQP